MEQQIHLSNIDTVNKALGDLGKYRQYMNDEQADFVDCARYAKDEQMEWKGQRKAKIDIQLMS